MRKYIGKRTLFTSHQNYLLIILLLFTSVLHTQTHTSLFDKNSNSFQEQNSPGVIVTSVVKGDSILATYTLDMNEEVNMIVQFKSPPLAVIKSKREKISLDKLSRAQMEIESEHTQFRTDVSRIENEFRTKSNTIFTSANTQIRFEYKTALNGIALTTKRWLIEEVKKLPYVKDVYEDKEVKALDYESNHIIGADSVWINLGATGKGIIIGILDTGIDYMHPDLGGGIGPDKKVIGGYDFVNNDNDPMDDNDHGTHVAGIAAANSDSLKGVAPDAKLMGFKVLNANGDGYFSWAIAGIERALDPDENPSTDDGVHVINLSLGGWGDPDDPLSQAVDNAVTNGVVCAVAAGNRGSSYKTIDSPGCARKAITVGAADNSDNIANFSSRGPSDITFDIKPDILAPGVGINSTKMGGGYITYSGTSMATPHVAGAVALLLELNPDWEPENIKNALKQSAQDINYDIWTQGKGRINVYNATKLNAIVTQSINFGLDDLTQSIWLIEDTVTISNISDSQLTYDFSLEGNYPAGLNLSFNPSTVIINPGEKANTIVSLSVNNNITPNINVNQNNWLPYNARITASSNIDEVTIPFSFIKSPYLELIFEGNLLSFILHNQKDFIRHGGLINNELILLDEGTYDVVAYFYGSDFISGKGYQERLDFIGHENITVESNNILTVKQSDAKYTYTIEARDHNNQILSTIMNRLKINFVHTPSLLGMHFNRGGFDFIPNIKYSSFSSDYQYEWYMETYANHRPFYVLKGILNNFTTNQLFKNSSSEFKHITLNYNFTANVEQVMLLQYLGIGYKSAGAVYGRENEEYFLPPFIQEAYIIPDPSPEFLKNISLYNFQEALQSTGPSYFDRYSSELYYLIPWLKVTYDSKIESYFFFDELDPSLKINTNKITYGLGPSHWFGKFANDNSSIRIKTNTEYGYLWETNGGGVNKSFLPLFPSQLQDASPKFLRFSLFDANNTNIQNGYLTDYLTRETHDNGICEWLTRIWLPSPAGVYTLEIPDTNYTIQGKRGNALMRATMNTQLADKNPPSMKTLNIFANGEFTDVVTPNQTGDIRFSVSDDIGLENVSLLYKPESENEWSNLQLSNIEDEYSTVIPNDLPNEFISLKIVAEDKSGNILGYTVEPAFKYSENSRPSSFALLAPVNNDTLSMEIPFVPIEFVWESSLDTDGDLLKYLFNIAGPDYDTTLVDISDTLISLDIRNRLQPNSIYTWSVSVTDGSDSIASSQPHTFFTDNITATHNLNPSWNLKSFLNVQSDSVSSVFGEIMDRLSILLSYNNGALIYNPLLNPSYNNLHIINPLYGYWLKMNSQSSLNILGDIIDPQTPIYLNKGWNLVSYLPMKPDSIRNALRSIEENLIVVMGFNQGGQTFYPELSDDLNSLNILSPGYGYWIKVNEVDTLIYPANQQTVSSVKAQLLAQKGELIESTTDIIPTNEWINLYADYIEVNYEPLKVGSRIIAKDPDGITCGEYIVKTEGKFGLMPIYRDDFTTPDADEGAEPGDEITIFIDDLEIKNKIVWADNGQLINLSEIITNILLDELTLPVTYDLSQNYPNPFNPTTTIKYQIPKEGRVEIKIYNILGQEVKNLVNKEQIPGYYTVQWDGTNDNNLIISTGVYIFRMVSGDYVQSKKMIILK